MVGFSSIIVRYLESFNVHTFSTANYIRQMFENNSILCNDTRVFLNLSDCHNLDSIFHSYSESGGRAPLTRMMFPYNAVSLEEKENLLSEKVLISLTAKIWKAFQHRGQPGQ